MYKVSTHNKKVGFIFEGNSTQEVLKAIWDTIQNHGSEYPGQRGKVRSIKGALMVINNPLNEAKNYPYWNKIEDDWYQNNFVRKETNNPPETIGKNEDIYSYKYAWRSRYYDSGLGYVKGVTTLLKKLGIKKIKFKKKADLEKLLKQTFKLYHPETILAVLSWKGAKLLDFYLSNSKILDLELQMNRRDTLLSIIDEIKHSPSSRRAIIPSFTYEHIDHSGAAGGVPVYQSYQLYVNFDKKGKPSGLISMHLHRAMDAKGGTQLDITHDREWGMIASKAIGLPLEQIVIYCNDIWHQVAEGKQEHLEKKTDIRNWLFSVTDSYEPKIEDIEKRLFSPTYQKKMEYTLKKLA